MSDNKNERRSRTAILSVFFMLAVAMLLGACGGGGGGGEGGSSNTSISVSHNTLTFDTEQNGTPPAAQLVTVTYQGDGVVVGTVPGQQPPPWLVVAADGQASATQAVFQIRVLQTTMAPGRYSTSVRFVTGHSDGSGVKTADVTVIMNVAEKFGLSSSTQLVFTEIDGDPAGAAPTNGIERQILGDSIEWRAEATQSWIQLSETSGNAKGPLTISVDRQGLSVGTYGGSVLVTDDLSGRTIGLSVVYVIRPAALVFSESSLSFELTPETLPSELSATLVVTDDLGGVNPAKDLTWSASAGHPWLVVSPSAGATSPPTTLTVRVDPSRIGLMASGEYAGYISVSYVNSAGRDDDVRIPVSLLLRMPLALTVSPYLLAPSAPTTVIVRGEDFQDSDLALLRVDGLELSDSPSLVSSTSISVPLPALGPGSTF